MYIDERRRDELARINVQLAALDAADAEPVDEDLRQTLEERRAVLLRILEADSAANRRGSDGVDDVLASLAAELGVKGGRGRDDNG